MCWPRFVRVVMDGKRESMKCLGPLCAYQLRWVVLQITRGLERSSDMLDYYNKRLQEYEAIYAKPERQADLSILLARLGRPWQPHIAPHNAVHDNLALKDNGMFDVQHTPVASLRSRGSTFDVASASVTGVPPPTMA